MKISDIYKEVEKQVKTNPRKCERCGVVETMDNLILQWACGDGHKLLCDNCAFEIFDVEDLLDFNEN